jgi:hypothetical protein
MVNAPVAALAASPRWGRLLRGNIAMLTYVGRRSGRTFTLPVGYRQVGDEIRIGVQMPDAKTWWRNFLGAGGPLTLRLNGADRPGHGVAEKDERNRVTVTVRLDDSANDG